MLEKRKFSIFCLLGLLFLAFVPLSLVEFSIDIETNDTFEQEITEYYIIDIPGTAGPDSFISKWQIYGAE